jgi:FkbM family methyltransferase
MSISRLLKRWRENYYCSAVLAAAAKPVYGFARSVSSQIERKIRKNGLALALPVGRTLRLDRDAGVTVASVLFWKGLAGYEEHTSKTLRFFFERATTFVDVGANYGIYSMMAALWNPNLRVMAFEPVPQIFDALRRNVALNGLEERISLHQVALADQTGTATFYLPSSGSNDLEATGTLAAASWQASRQSPTIEVRTARFDDWQPLPAKINLVKIDVEDFEASVLTGMEQTIRRDRPFIVCEILPRSHRNEKTRQVLASLEYTPYWITPSGYIRVSSFDFERRDLRDFLLSPVTPPGEVISNPAVFWDLRQGDDLKLQASSTV